MKPLLNIVIFRPPGYIHSSAFQEVAESIYFAALRLGYTARLTENSCVTDAINILFGIHLLDPQMLDSLPKNSIIYNLEQIDANNEWLRNSFRFISHFTTWDYSQRNIERSQQLGLNAKILWVPIGFVPELARIPAVLTQDIDVLFYGSINPRRQSILDILKQKGINVVAAFSSYGKSRDELIARAKLVINIHYYETNIFELVRVSYLLANSKAVVAEVNDGTEIEADLRQSIAAVPYKDLVDECLHLLVNQGTRQELANKGFINFSKRDTCEILNNALMHSFAG